MEHTIKINITELISFESVESKKRIVMDAIYNEICMGDAPKIIKHILTEMLESEFEFDNREDVIKAYKTLIDKIE